MCVCVCVCVCVCASDTPAVVGKLRLDMVVVHLDPSSKTAREFGITQLNTYIDPECTVLTL